MDNKLLSILLSITMLASVIINAETICANEMSNSTKLNNLSLCFF
jgi:hypothetical protein